LSDYRTSGKRFGRAGRARRGLSPRGHGPRGPLAEIVPLSS